MLPSASQKSLSLWQKSTGHAKVVSYDIVATTLREKVHVSKEQFKAFFLALMADKEFTRIFDAIPKIDKSFNPLSPASDI